MEQITQSLPAMDHRWGHRIPCGARVRLSGGAEHAGTGRMRNVSMSGAFVESKPALPLDSPVTIAVVRGDPTAETGLAGFVVRRERDGFAIEWAETQPSAICPLLGCVTPCPAARFR